ncbi:sigma-70 family RNA polymerase sigma factor [Chryseobacterium sp. JK1]|uniref:sigma-70 family RNA polymerase sigma factor n=1 Tax=Chryseobacterium sp. JK1 TaxID=874294 RepID=UPI003D686AB1
MKECCNLDEIVKEFYTILLFYTIKKTGNREASEDIVQEVMSRIVQAHQKETEISNIRAWLFQITRFVIADFYREKYKMPDFHSDEFPEVADDDVYELSIFDDPITRMIHLLPDQYAVPLVLSDIDGIPQKKIAEQLNLSLSATKMRIQRARQKLHDLFIDCCDITYNRNGAFISCTVKPTCKSLF